MNWKGGRVRLKKGYVLIHKPDHPLASKSGYVYEHRLIMEDILGRYLEPEELIHHINAVKNDNRPENLSVINQSKHISLHWLGRDRADMTNRTCKKCGSRNTRLKKLPSGRYRPCWHLFGDGFQCDDCHRWQTRGQHYRSHKKNWGKLYARI